MTIEQLRKEFIKNYIENAKSFDDNLTEDDVIKGIERDIKDDVISYELQEAIANATNISISDLFNGTNDYENFREATYFSYKLGYNIILDSYYNMGKSVDEFFDNLLDLDNKKLAIEEKLK
jgi:hypothetical protein